MDPSSRLRDGFGTIPDCTGLDNDDFIDHRPNSDHHRAFGTLAAGSPTGRQAVQALAGA